MLAEEYDEYDAEFDKMRKATLETRHALMNEDYIDVQNRMDECRNFLHHAHSRVGLIRIILG